MRCPNCSGPLTEKSNEVLTCLSCNSAFTENSVTDFWETGSNKPKKLPGFKHFCSSPNNEPIVSMLKFEGEIFVATEGGVYILDTDKKKLNPISFNMAKP